jgi:hypothetical protein
LYLAAEPDIYFSGILRVTPRRYRATVDACAASAVRNLRCWLLAQMFSMAASAHSSHSDCGLWVSPWRGPLASLLP